MIDTLQLYEELKRHLPPEAAEKIAHTFFHVYGELQESLTKKDLDEVRDSVRKLQEMQDTFAQHLEAVDQRFVQLLEIQVRTEERLDALAAAQARTEQRLDSLAARVEELAEAQKRTEQKVEELAEAQKRTEQRLDNLAVRVEELAEAQARTEQRLDNLAARVEELAEAQKRTEQKVEELAEAQKRTEQKVKELAVAQARTEQRLDSLAARVEELAEAQKRTEQKVEELAEAQKRTEKALEQLAKAQSRLGKRMNETQKILGGLSMAVGYGLEDRVLPFIPLFAKETYGMDVRTVDRRFILMANGSYEEVNLYAEGSYAEGPCFIIGECKAQPGKKDADRFARKLSRLSKVLQGKIFPILVGYLFDPEVERYAREKYPEIRLVKSSHFSLLYGKSAGWFMFEV